MPYHYLEEGVTSDVSFRIWGADLETVFADAAEATLRLMVDVPDTVRPETAVPVALRADALDLLLLAFLDELVFHKDARRLLLRATDVRVTAALNGYALTATLRGEVIDPARHALATDVKAVTLHGLRVTQTATGWHAEVTVDV
jgi:SHS2 domain-containing protein